MKTLQIDKARGSWGRLVFAAKPNGLSASRTACASAARLTGNGLRSKRLRGHGNLGRCWSLERCWKIDTTWIEIGGGDVCGFVVCGPVEVEVEAVWRR